MSLDQHLSEHVNGYLKKKKFVVRSQVSWTNFRKTLAPYWIPFSEICSVLVYILKALRSLAGENYVYFYSKMCQIYFITESFLKNCCFRVSSRMGKNLLQIGTIQYDLADSRDNCGHFMFISKSLATG